MSNLANRSRRTQQRNRQSRNRNSSRRQIRNQRGRDNVEVSIYSNLKESESSEILTRPLTQSEKQDVETYVYEGFIQPLTDPLAVGEDMANLFKSLTNQSIEQLPSPYKNYHFLLKLTMPETETHKLVDKQFLKKFMENIAGDYIRFDQGKD